MTDLFPTLLAAAGSKPEPSWKVDGLDVLPAWLGQGHVPERTLFWEWRSEGGNQIAAMRGRFKLVTVNNGQPELFDVEADPGERRNIIAEHGEMATRLRAEVKAWLATETRN
jgi:arylsulfatase A-like enzyme